MLGSAGRTQLPPSLWITCWKLTAAVPTIRKNFSKTLFLWNNFHCNTQGATFQRCSQAVSGSLQHPHNSINSNTKGKGWSSSRGPSKEDPLGKSIPPLPSGNRRYSKHLGYSCQCFGRWLSFISCKTLKDTFFQGYIAACKESFGWKLQKDSR